jgi:threonine synthase
VDNITNSQLDELVVTDTIPLKDAARVCSKIRQLSVAEMLPKRCAASPSASRSARCTSTEFFVPAGNGGDIPGCFWSRKHLQPPRRKARQQPE